MNYKEAKTLIKSIMDDVHYAPENSEEYYPFDDKKIIQMMSEIRQDEEISLDNDAYNYASYQEVVSGRN